MASLPGAHEHGEERASRSVPLAVDSAVGIVLGSVVLNVITFCLL
jgi:hypothetical protein